MYDSCHRSHEQAESVIAGIHKRRSTVDQSIRKYKDHFSFLRDAKFIRELENDSVDSDIIDEELSVLRHSVSLSTREKVVKFLQSNPVQVLLCVIVLLDAGIVIAQILLDLNYVKEKLHRRDRQLSSLVDYVRGIHTDRLRGYDGSDVERILWLLRNSAPTSTFVIADNPTASWSTGDLVTFDRLPQPTAPPQFRENYSIHDVSGDLATSNGNRSNETTVTFKSERDTSSAEDMDSMSSLAHGLHFASIGMLGFLVIEDLVKIVAMGKNFCRHRIEIVDAIIITSSFTIDLIFLGGVSGEEGQKAVAVLIVLLLWRVARVVDGIVVTVKQRQEFRIRLQKRARRAAERKLDSFEEERLIRTKQVEALKRLCLKAGIRDAEIAACSVAHFGTGNSALGALSSVAHLSVSMTMLMSSATHFSERTPERHWRGSQRQGPRHQHHQHQRQQQGENHSSPCVIQPGSSSGDDCVTIGRTPSIWTTSLDQSDMVESKHRTRHETRGGCGRTCHKKLVSGVFGGSGTRTSISSTNCSKTTTGPSRIESLPNVNRGSPISQPVTSSSSPAARCKVTSPAAQSAHRDGNENDDEDAGFRTLSALSRHLTPDKTASKYRSKGRTVESAMYEASARSNYGMATSDEDNNDNDLLSTSSGGDCCSIDTIEPEVRPNSPSCDLRSSVAHQSPVSYQRKELVQKQDDFKYHQRSPGSNEDDVGVTETNDLSPMADDRRIYVDKRRNRWNKPSEASPINCTGVRIVVGGSSESDDLCATGISGGSVFDFPLPATSGGLSTSKVNLPVGFSSATSDSSSQLKSGEKNSLTGSSLDSAFVVDSDFHSPMTPMSSSSQIFLLSDSLS